MRGARAVYLILCQSNLNNPPQKPRVKRSYIRWERKHSNSLWQCDLKIVGSEWLITILDDHSRYVTASEIFKEGTAENVLWLLDQAIHECSKSREILTDHESQFYSVRRGGSSFSHLCRENAINHILGGIGKPTTPGKIERWFRTYDWEHARFQLHRKFVEYYNWKRPHMSLSYNTPAQVYFRDVPNVLGQHNERWRNEESRGFLKLLAIAAMSTASIVSLLSMSACGFHLTLAQEHGYKSKPQDPHDREGKPMLLPLTPPSPPCLQGI